MTNFPSWMKWAMVGVVVIAVVAVGGLVSVLIRSQCELRDEVADAFKTFESALIAEAVSNPGPEGPPTEAEIEQTRQLFATLYAELEC